MNNTERQMFDMLLRGRDHFGVVAIKAEFEAEGTRSDEFLRLLHMTHKADLKVALKIGGCEAVSDLLASKLYGVDYIIAPMVETPYALSKFIDAKNKTHGTNPEGVEFLYNLETQSTLDNLDAMLPVTRKGGVGVVFGRVDFTMSRGLPRDSVNSDQITQAVLRVARQCAQHDIPLVVGGSVSLDAIDALRQFRAHRLDRFETRKVVFDGSAVENSNITLAIENAVNFELAWLKNKRDYYSAIAQEDQARITMMEQRQLGTKRVAAA